MTVHLDIVARMYGVDKHTAPNCSFDDVVDDVVVDDVVGDGVVGDGVDDAVQ